MDGPVFDVTRFLTQVLLSSTAAREEAKEEDADGGEGQKGGKSGRETGSADRRIFCPLFVPSLPLSYVCVRVCVCRVCVVCTVTTIDLI